MELFIIPLFFVGLGIVAAVWYFSSDQRIKRALREAKRHTISAFPDGSQGKIAGRLELLPQVLQAPLSGRPCAYYSIIVEQYRSNSKGGGSWRTVIREEKGVDFILRDDTGHALIDVAASKLALTMDHKSESGAFDDTTVREEEFLNSHSQKGKGWFFNRRLRYKEAVLEQGEMVAIFGYGIREPDSGNASSASGGYRSAAAMRLRVSGTNKFPSLISDEPNTTS